MSCESSVPALLLAAGLGTRLAPLTNSIPKCLVPIHTKPLLGHWFDLLGNANYTPILVNTHHHAESVRQYVAANPWRNHIRLLHEKTLKGTGGTLLANRKTLETGTFFIAHADNLSRFSAKDFLTAHRNRPNGCIITMMLFRTPTPQSCGVVELDSHNVVTAFHEKAENPPGNLANGAVYLMEPEVFPILDETTKTKQTPDLSLDLIPRCLGKINTWLNDDYHRDIGTPESYEEALREFKAP